ncbi:MAG: DUF2380 domain-containing protein [Myxococcales bacterium]
MHRLLACVLLLAACKGVPPRPLPSAPWTRGAAMWLHTDPQHNAYNMPEASRPYAETDLRSAGIDSGNQPGALEVVLAGDDDSKLAVTVSRDGQPVERFTLAYNDMECHKFPATNLSTECVGREIASHLIESGAVARAARERAPAPRPQGSSSRKLAGKLAVLDLRNFTKDLTRENAQYFTDVVRGAALKAQPQLEVMTRENLLVLLQASGKDLASCEGECEVDTGRRIGADQIVSGEIQKLGSLYKLSLRLHDTREGRLLASTQASGKTIEELDQSAQQAAADLLR